MGSAGSGPINTLNLVSKLLLKLKILTSIKSSERVSVSSGCASNSLQGSESATNSGVVEHFNFII